jgi:hypothetical protein
MAVNGDSPIIIVQKYNNIITGGTTNNENNDIEINKIGLLDGFKSWRNVKDIKQLKNGVAIPFPLRIETGLIVVDEALKLSANLNYEERVKLQDQRQNSLIVRMTAVKTNPVALAFVILAQYLWNNLQSYNYDISYFNDGLFIKQGHLGDLTIDLIPGKNLFDISLTLDNGDAFVSEFIRKKEEQNLSSNSLHENEPLAREIEIANPY